MKADTVAIILGRKGSSGIKNKNRMSLLGRPISHYSIMAAINSKYVSDIYLSTNDEEIKNQSEKFSLKIINRPEILCTDEALFEDALVHGFNEIIKEREKKPDFLVILMCNVVTIDSTLIDQGVEALIKDPEADSAVTVSKLNMYSPLRARRMNDEGYLLPFVPFETFGDPKNLTCDRDSQGDVYYADMSHSISRSAALDQIEEGLLPQKWMGTKILPIKNSFGCDIDDIWQIDASIGWLREKGFTEAKTPYDKTE